MNERESVYERETGMPGGGAGRKDFVGPTGVYRLSDTQSASPQPGAPHPSGDAPIVPMGSWGQGERGAAGYEDHGESELFFRPATPEKCRDIMTKDPICCLVSESAERVARLMKKHDIGVLPVVGNRKSKKLVGVVTDRDLVLNVVADGLDPAATVTEVAMSKPAIRCSPDDPWQTALDLMEKHKIRRVPVTDDSGRVVGLIAQSDVALRLRDAQKTGEVVESISQPDPARA